MPFQDFVLYLLHLAITLTAGFFMQRALMRLVPLPLSRRSVSSALRCAFVWMMFTVVFGMPSWIGDENPTLMLPLFLAVMLLFTGGDWLGRLVLSGIFYALLIPVNMAVDTFIRSGHLFDTQRRMESAVPVLLKCVIWIVLAWVVSRTAPSGGLRLARRQWVLLGGLTLAPLMAMMSLSLWNDDMIPDQFYGIYNATLNRIAATTLPFVFLSSFALLFSAVRFSRQEALEREAQMAALREVYYDGVKQEQAQVRTLRHDLRNHLTALQGLLARGEAQQAQDYAAQLAQSPALMGGARLCENEVANVVLTGKAAAMETLGLIADFSAALPEALPLPAPELCALLGNALDNAMEAAQTAADKTVLLRARADKGMLMLRVENAIGTPVQPRAAGEHDERWGSAPTDTSARSGAPAALFATTKANARAHGFGLAGMSDIAQRHGGTLEATAENGRFTLLVCVPLAETSKTPA